MARRKTQDPLSGVGPDDALSVLRQLLARRPELSAEVVAVLTERAATVDREEIAENLADRLQSIRIEDVWAQSGRTAYGYVDPGEKAAEMLLEAAADELTQLERLLDQGEASAAKEVLLGIVLAADALGADRTNPVLLEAGGGLDAVPFVAAERWTQAGGGPGVLTEIVELSPRWGRVLERAFRRSR